MCEKLYAWKLPLLQYWKSQEYTMQIQNKMEFMSKHDKTPTEQINIGTKICKSLNYLELFMEWLKHAGGDRLCMLWESKNNILRPDKWVTM